MQAQLRASFRCWPLGLLASRIRQCLAPSGAGRSNDVASSFAFSHDTQSHACGADRKFELWRQMTPSAAGPADVPAAWSG